MPLLTHAMVPFIKMSLFEALTVYIGYICLEPSALISVFDVGEVKIKFLAK
jgi:hypothetical protein